MQKVLSILTAIAVLCTSCGGARKTYYETPGGLTNAQSTDLASIPDGFLVSGWAEMGDGPTNGGFVMRLNQNGKERWTHEVNSPFDDQLFAVRATSDGGGVAVGRFGKSASGDSDICAVRLGPSGSRLWMKQYTHLDAAEARDVAVLPDGGLVIAGTAESRKSGAIEIVLIGTDPQGVEHWRKVLKDGGQQRCNALHVADDGSMTVAGTDVTERVGLVVKLDASQNIKWTTQLKMGNSAELWGLDDKPNGGYFVAGRVIIEQASSMPLVASLDGEGKVIWQRPIPGSDFAAASCIATCKEGGAIVAGFTTPEGKTKVMNATFAKLADDGAEVWTHTIDRYASSTFNAVACVEDGLALAGSCSSGGIVFAPCFIKTDQDGKFEMPK